VSSVPSRELHQYVASQREKGKNEVWLTIRTNPTTGEIVYVKTGRNSELLWREIHLRSSMIKNFRSLKIVNNDLRKFETQTGK